MSSLRSRAVVFWAVVAVVVLLDVITKRLVVAHLTPGVPHAIVGDLFRLTLGYNRGAAFGTSIGEASRVVFTLVALAIVAVLWRLWRETPPENRLRALALALVMGGALGNLVDRLRWSRGVVDFVDVGIGTHRFWIFNVADSAVTVGAILLGWELLRERGAPTGERGADEAGKAPERVEEGGR